MKISTPYIICLPLALLVLIFALSADAPAAEKGRLYVVGMGPSGADLAAPRALDIVQKADVYLCSPGMPDKFYMFEDYIDPKKVAFNPWENIMGGKAGKLKKTDPEAWRTKAEKQREKVQGFVREQINKGKTVVMMDGGDPCIYGPSLHYLLEGFDPALFEVIPGMSALNAAGAALKTSLTPSSARFVLLTSPRSMFGENWEKEDDILKDLARYDATLVWYMSIRSMERVIKKFNKYYPPDLPIAIVYYAGYPEKQKVLRSRLKTILEDVRKMDEKWLGLFIAGECAK
ncbi:MAG: SAM-dependent methyltransferase [Desulfobacterales bacterium]